MRTFKIVPEKQEADGHHAWTLVIVEEDGLEVAIETYATMNEAEAAKLVLERQEVDIRS